MFDRCQQCGSDAIEYDEARADSVCTSCGSVLEQSSIQTDQITFQELPSGGHQVVGQKVPQGGLRGVSSTTNKVYSSEHSREAALRRGAREVYRIADHVRLSPNIVDAAKLIYGLCLQHNLVQGRSVSLIAGACVYIVCRREKTAHMLLDISDALQVDVFKLGKTFLKLLRLLHMKLPVVDPSIYIHRFAGALELDSGRSEQIVSMTALRLVARMRRDWINTGRRPAGICGACLLIACRLHGYQRSAKEIAHVVKMEPMTIKKRLREFAATPTSDLTFDEFQKTDLEEQCNPPSFSHQAEEEEDDIDFAEGPVEEADIEQDIEQLVESEDLKKAVNAEASTRPGGLEDLGDVDDVEKHILSEHDAKLKERVWHETNKEYLEQQDLKQQYEEIEMASSKRRSMKRKRLTKKKEDMGAETASKAASNALSKRAPSSRINYEALDRLLGPSKGKSGKSV